MNYKEIYNDEQNNKVLTN